MNARSLLAAGFCSESPPFAPAEVFIPWQVAVLVGWDTMATTFVGSVCLPTRGKDSAATKEMATVEDNSRVAAHTPGPAGPHVCWYPVLRGAAAQSRAGREDQCHRTAEPNGNADKEDGDGGRIPRNSRVLIGERRA
jgi:hypothetical protein